MSLFYYLVPMYEDKQTEEEEKKGKGSGAEAELYRPSSVSKEASSNVAIGEYEVANPEENFVAGYSW
jgi:hypothetical protein